MRQQESAATDLWPFNNPDLNPYPLKPTLIIWDSCKASCAIFDIWALWRTALSVRVPGCQKLQTTA